jgi:cell division protein FtsB
MAVLGIFVWGISAILFGPGGTFHVLKLRQQAERVDLEVARLAAACDSLERVLMAVEGPNTAALEWIAREEFGFARDNERIYVLPADAVDRQLVDRARQWVGAPGSVPPGGD